MSHLRRIRLLPEGPFPPLGPDDTDIRGQSFLPWLDMGEDLETCAVAIAQGDVELSKDGVTYSTTCDAAVANNQATWWMRNGTPGIVCLSLTATTSTSRTFVKLVEIEVRDW